MSRLKHMLGLYQMVVAGVCSVVVGSADAPVLQSVSSQNMCINDSLEQRVEQCRIEEDMPKLITNAERKKQQYAALQRMLASKKMIVEESVLEAVIQV